MISVETYIPQVKPMPELLARDTQPAISAPLPHWMNHEPVTTHFRGTRISFAQNAFASSVYEDAPVRSARLRQQPRSGVDNSGILWGSLLGGVADLAVGAVAVKKMGVQGLITWVGANALVARCGTAPQVVEVATATPQAVETVSAKAFYEISDTQATNAMLEWQSPNASGVNLDDANKNGTLEWHPSLNILNAVDNNIDGKPFVGKMSVIIAETNKADQEFILYSDGINTKALLVANINATDKTNLISADLVDVNGVKQATLAIYPQRSPWATIVYNAEPNTPAKSYDVTSTIDTKPFENISLGSESTVNYVPLTPTAEAATAVPTEAAPTEAAAAKIIDVSKSSSEWDLSSLSADQQAAIKNWLANPSGATEQEKQIADDFLTKQWQLTLETDATGKALYEKIVAYAQSHGGEVGLIPNSLHLQVRTDKDNLVVYGSAPGMDKYVHTSWYGFGANVSNPSMHIIEREVVKIPQINYFGEAIKREGSVYPVTSAYAVEGDLIGIFDIVGVPRSEAQGAIIKMIDQKGVTRYTEIQIQYASTLKTSANDMCTQMEGNQIVGGNCEEGLNLPITTISSFKTPNDNKEINNQLMVQVLKDSNGKLHVVIYSSGTINGKTIYGIWQNGASASQAIDVFSDIQIP